MGVFGYYSHYASGSQDGSGIFYFFGFVIALLLISWLWGAINDSIDKQAKARADRIIAAQRSDADGYLERKKIEADNYQKAMIAQGEAHLLEKSRSVERSQKISEAEMLERQKFLDDTRAQLEIGYIQGRHWLARFIANAETAGADSVVARLRTKARPALVAADQVKAAKLEKREAIEKLKFLEYKLATYEEYFPALAEYGEIIMAEMAGFERGNDLADVDETVDRAAVYLRLPKEEYEKLPERERNQRALDIYVARNKSPLEIGRSYERYLGYLYEMGGWDVRFHGAQKGLEDMGRDLICFRKDEIHVVQAKCWSQRKVIHEKHLFQLYGTCLHYQITEKKIVFAIFATTTQLSDVAALAAQLLGITVWNQKLEQHYPLIKCNINQESLIYHLPFDQQYDRVKIRPDRGEFYAFTVADAEERGFRRARKFFGTAGP